MSTTDDSKHHFEELKAASLQEDAQIYGSDLWSSWHDLAEHDDPLAKEFFVERLDDPRSSWREICLSLLGFHYELDEQIINKIRDLVLHDPDSGVRVAAFGVLGHQGTFPERTLIHALGHDVDEFVRKYAFDALLNLASVPWKVRILEKERIKSGEFSPSLDQVKRVLREQNLVNNLSLLEEIKDNKLD